MIPNNTIKCKICEKKCTSCRGLSMHVVLGHKIEIKDYYDKYFKKENEEKCKECGKNTKFLHISEGYRPFCGLQCLNKNQEVRKKIKATCLIKYGVDNPSKNKKIKNKTKKTCLKKYGFESPRQNPKIKEKSRQTCLKRYGVEFTAQSQQKKANCIKTFLKRFGAGHPSKSKEVKNKTKKTCLKKYGVEYLFQSNRIKEKIKQTHLKHFGCGHWAKSSQGRKNHRENTIKRIETQKLNGEPLCPSIGKNERKCLNELQKHCSYRIIRNINIDGYYPDGLVKKIKLCVEFDERYHNYEKQIKHDKTRDDYFRSLGYNVFRVKEKDWNEDKNKVIKQFKKTIQRGKQCRKTTSS